MQFHLLNEMNYFYLAEILIILICTSVKASEDSCDIEGGIRVWKGPAQRRRQDYVQLCVNNTQINLNWKYICDEGWGESEATILCREVGYIGVKRTNRLDTTKYSRYWSEVAAVNNIRCDSNHHDRLGECGYNVSRMANCRFVRGVVCNRCREDQECTSPGLCLKNGKCECVAECMNGGTCIMGACACQAGFHGVQCEKCNITCGNGGECGSKGGCECKEGYHGDRCEYKECIPNCGKNRMCLENGICSCRVGYEGDMCETKMTEEGDDVITIHSTGIDHRNSTTASPTKSVEKIKIPAKALHVNQQLAGYVMIGISSSILVLLCCCHLAVLLIYLKTKKMGKGKLAEVDRTLHSTAVSPSSQTESKYYQIPTVNNSVNFNKKGDVEYTSMRLVTTYQKEGIKTEISERTKLRDRDMLSAMSTRVGDEDNSSYTYVQMNPLI